MTENMPGEGSAFYFSKECRIDEGRIKNLSRKAGSVAEYGKVAKRTKWINFMHWGEENR